MIMQKGIVNRPLVSSSWFGHLPKRTARWRQINEAQSFTNGVFDYSAHHHYIVVLPHYHDGYTALRRTAGKHGLHGVNSHHVTRILQRSLLFLS